MFAQWTTPDAVTAGMAGLALVVSVTAAAYARRQANAQRGIHEIERDRAHQARRPDVTAWFSSWINEWDTAELRIVNGGGTRVPLVTLELKEGPIGSGFIAAPGERPAWSYTASDIEPGDRTKKVVFQVVDRFFWDDEQRVPILIMPSDGEQAWEPRIKWCVLPGNPESSMLERDPYAD